jgi:hypothetical protein
VPWPDDLVTLLEAAGVGTFGRDIYISSMATIPRLDSGAIVSIIETGGTSPDNTQNSPNAPAYVNPGAMIMVRGFDAVAARRKAVQAYNACYITNRNIVVINPALDSVGTTTWYQKIRPLNEPNDLKPDEPGNARVTFNILGKKRP